MKNNIALFIDTSKIEEITVALTIDGKRYEKISQSRQMKAQMVLPLIESLLKEHELKVQDITEITVHEGPGSYTGLRVGMSVANTLAFLLGIPVNGHTPPLSPKYE